MSWVWPPAVREGRADEQRACEAGTLRVSDRIQVQLPGTGLVQNRADQGKEPPDVIAGRELGNHAAVRVVQCDLRVQSVGEKPAGAVVDRRPALVARGLDAKNQHDS
jgi:hypothetical protein